MSVAITFCYETEYERGKDKRNNSHFHGSETESLPHLINE